MKKILTLVLAALLALSMICAASAEETALKIGLAENNIDGAWRVCEVDDFTAACEKRGWELIVTNAGGDIEKELADVDDLITQGVAPRAAMRMVREEAVQCLAKAL